MSTECWIRSLLLAALAALPLATRAGEPAATAGVCRVVIVEGLPGTPVHARRFGDWLQRMRTYMIDRAGVPAGQVAVLSGDAALKGPGVAPGAGADAVVAAIRAAADLTTAADQFVLVLVGHGDTSDGEPVFCLPGRDLRAPALKDALAAVKARQQVVLHFGGASGDMVPVLAATNRVVVAATAFGEIADPVFAEFFLLELERAAAGRPPSLLEAFNRASLATAQWIRRISQTEAGWRVDGKEAIRLFRKLSEGPADMPGARTLDPASKPTEPDPVVPLVSPGSQEAAAKAGIPARVRVVSEHAVLEDLGHEAGVSAMRPDGYTAIVAAQAGDPGYLAARTVIGHVGPVVPTAGAVP